MYNLEEELYYISNYEPNASTLFDQFCRHVKRLLINNQVYLILIPFFTWYFILANLSMINYFIQLYKLSRPKRKILKIVKKKKKKKKNS